MIGNFLKVGKWNGNGNRNPGITGISREIYEKLKFTWAEPSTKSSRAIKSGQTDGQQNVPFGFIHLLGFHNPKK